MHAFRPLACCLLLLLLLALHLGACSPDGPSVLTTTASAPYAEVPLTFDDSTYAVVTVTIGTQDSLLFVLDTAAYPTVIAPWVRDTLGLAANAADSMTVRGAGGEAGYQTLTLDSLQVGGQVVRDLQTPVVDLARLERSGLRYAGILGNRALKNFDVVYDLPARRLRLYPLRDSTSSIAGLDAMQRIPFEDLYGGAGGFVKVRLAVGDGEADALLDTGAPETILNWQAAALAGVTRDMATQSSSLQGIDGRRAMASSLYTFDDLRAGPVPFPPTEARIADLPVFRALGLGDGPAAILGNDLVANRTVVLAYSTGHLYLSAPR